MLKKDLATALGISGSMVSRLAKQGMPTDTPERAQRWRTKHLSMGKMRGDRIGQPAPTSKAERLCALRDQVRGLDVSAALPLADWLLLLEWMLHPNAQRRLSAMPPTIKITAQELSELIAGGGKSMGGALWFSEACDWNNLAGTLVEDDE